MAKIDFNLRLFARVALLVVLFLCGTANVNAQAAASWKEKPVTLRVSNQPLARCLRWLPRQQMQRLHCRRSRSGT